VTISMTARLVQIRGQSGRLVVAMEDCVIASGVHNHLRWHGLKGLFQGSGCALFDTPSRP
jgi:hypothetical protein